MSKNKKQTEETKPQGDVQSDRLISWRGAPAPDYVTETILLFLDKTREGGEVNMFGSGPLVQDNFPVLSSSEARKCVTYWMETFSVRHP